MKSMLSQSYLFISGLIMMIVGVYIAIMTLDYMVAMAPQSPPPSTNILSDLRGMGGAMLVLGIYVFANAFRRASRQSALIIASVVSLSFVAFRSLSLILDGIPDMTIMMAYCIETLMAVFGVLLIKQRALALNKYVTEHFKVLNKFGRCRSSNVSEVQG